MKTKPEIILSQTLNSNIRSDLDLESKRAKMKLLGLEYISEGLDRIGYAQGDLVVKICKHCDSYKQTRKEIESYQEIPDKAKKYFNKPLAHAQDFSWIIFKRAKVEYSGLTHEESEDLANNLRKKLKRLKLYHSGPNDITSDIHSDNVGLINDKPIIIDYGI